MRKLGYWVVGWLFLAACAATPTAPPVTTAPTSISPTTQVPTTAAPTAAIAATSAPTATPVATSAPTATESAASPTQGDITPGAVHTVATGEVVKLAGVSFTTSDTYRFSADSILDISWTYTGTAPFAFWLINVSENVTDPNYDRILIDDVTGPHAGTSKQKITAGDWQVQVEQAEGPWTVQFTREP